MCFVQGKIRQQEHLFNAAKITGNGSTSLIIAQPINQSPIIVVTVTFKYDRFKCVCGGSKIVVLKRHKKEYLLAQNGSNSRFLALVQLHLLHIIDIFKGVV